MFALAFPVGLAPLDGGSRTHLLVPSLGSKIHKSDTIACGDPSSPPHNSVLLCHMVTLGRMHHWLENIQKCTNLCTSITPWPCILMAISDESKVWFTLLYSTCGTSGCVMGSRHGLRVGRRFQLMYPCPPLTWHQRCMFVVCMRLLWKSAHGWSHFCQTYTLTLFVAILVILWS